MQINKFSRRLIRLESRAAAVTARQPESRTYSDSSTPI